MAQRTLTFRERAMVLSAGAVFVAIIAFPLARGFARNYRETRTELALSISRLEDARSLRATLLEERAGQQLIADRLGAQGRRFNLYDFTNKTLSKSGLRDRMRLEKRLGTQRMDVVQVTLNNVTLKELIDFLHTLHNGSQLVALQNLSYLRPASGDKGLDAAVTLAAPRA